MIEITKNDILKNTGHGIHLIDVFPYLGDPKKVVIRNNQISEIKNGHGLFIENSSCHIDHNLIVKNN